jgi:hypothetical protein
MEFNSSDYCVYYHILNGEVIYIGSGSIGRAFNVHPRNKVWEYHTHYALKYGLGITVKIVATFPKKFQRRARKLEKIEIQRLRPIANIVRYGKQEVPYYLKGITKQLA